VRRGDGQGAGWYGTLGRPAFFALPPEASHRVAIALLGLPLPWERIGGAERNPALGVEVCGIPLPNPIGLAAGFDKACRRLGALGRLGFGFVVGGTVTRHPRRGNPKPRIVRDRDRRAIVNAMGMPNPGAEAAARSLARAPRTAPRFVSVADEAIDDALAACDLLAPHADAIELNASSPNAPWRHDPEHLRRLLDAFRAHTDRPLLLKLPPFSGEEERAGALGVARDAVDAGVSGLVCSNTLPVEEPRLAAGRGGLSGGPLTALTPEIVRDVAAATGRAVPIVACGGILTVEDVRACLRAGAIAVEVYTGLIYRGPGIVGELTRGLLRDGPGA
jgi:dihydroorotate dehydrogenase